MNRILSAIVLLFISAVTMAQSITITQPNGGEVLYSCQTYTVKWNSSGVSNYYNIDYSLNNGAIWTSIASNLNITNGQYTWTVPNAESNTCLLRVRDKNDTTKQDISDAVFSIHIPVVVTAPNGGESWTAGTSHPITWNIQGTSLTFKLEYSVNGGSSWSTIVSNLSTSVGTYNWVVPNNPSTNCLVRVSDAVTGCMTDMSDNPFTIVAAQPVLTAPNGGESLSPGCDYNITWLTSTFYSTVRLEYSADSGLTWNLISSGVTNAGSYSWTAPYGNGSKYFVSASNSANVALYDVSNAPFTVARTMTVNAPNGGESLLGCNSYTISFYKNMCVYGNYTVEYSTDSGATWNYISQLYSSNNIPTTHTVNWTVPNGVSSTRCLVRVYNQSTPTQGDTSNAVFTIQPNNVVTVTSPNGGEVLAALATKTITWTNTAGASGLYNVEYSSNNGSTWTTIATGVTGNSYNWSVPNIPTSTYLIRVSDNANTCRYDLSNANFTVTPAQPVLTAPNGGESLSPGCDYVITWLSSTFYSTLRLEYSSDSGLTWNLISNNETNDGAYSWTAPYNSKGKYLVRASNTANLSLNDVSNAIFSVARPITVNTPNGGEVLTGCNSVTVSFYKNMCVYGNYTVEYSTDSGATWNYISQLYSSNNVPTTHTVNWTVPNGINSTKCLVRAYSQSTPTQGDTSNAVFTIQASNVITVTSPNGGEVLPALTSKLISWTNTAGASGLYNVEYSSNNGSTWSTLATGISGNNYNWTNIPNNPATTYLVRVSDNANTCRNDVSDATFTVTAAQPILTAPNGGENLSPGCDYLITWNANTFYSNVRLDYSIDSGLTWTTITTNAGNGGSYSWTVPMRTGSKYLIKASNSANVNSNDVSNAVFSIGRTMTVTAPNGGESLLGCNSYTVSFYKNMCVYGNYTVEYSTDSGATWNYISQLYSSNNTPTAHTVNWTVPNGVSSTKCLVRVYNQSTPTQGDTSNAVFTILPNNVVTVTSPNGGEVLPALTTKSITWTNTAGASGLYNVEYSSNNGSTWTTLATGITGNSYNWNVPNIPTSTFLVRVSDNANTCRFDVSNANFTVTPAQPVLTSPNGGEVLQPGCDFTISWLQSTFYSTVRLEYSSDSGLTWNLISSGVTNAGSYTWTAPYNSKGKYLVRASNTANLSLNDVSNAVFSVGRPMTVNSPNGGETLLGCNSYTVSFYKNMCVYGNYNVEYSTDSGATWNYISQLYSSNNVPTTHTVNWTVPNGINSTKCLVRAYNQSTPTQGDTSNAVFTILPNNVITVTSPNGGEVLPALNTKLITWTNTAGASGLYNLEYSTNNGSTWFSIVSGISGNAYNWNVPNNPSSNCLVRVSDNANTCKSDVSDAVFTITPAQPVLTAPNGGEVLSPGCDYVITWQTSTFYSTLRLEYSADSGVTWSLISNNETNDGAYSWTAPYNSKGKYLVRASNTANITLNDVSNATFSVGRPITVNYPNGGETLMGCNTYTVSFYKNMCVYGNYNVEYSTDSGATWNYLTQLYSSNNVPTTHTVNWTVPNGINSTKCLVRAYSQSTPTQGDTSNAVFTIQASNVVTVTTPNGGEVLPALITKTITWTNTAGASGLYNVEYSPNNGASWVSVATGISGNSYNWVVPNNPSSTYLVRVSDNANTCKNDVSDAVFTVSPAQPVLTSPNGGEQWWSGSSYNITWLSSTFYGTIRLEYSLDNGTTWSLIANNLSNSGSYNWTVPNANSTTCLVKASVVSNLSLYDVSNSVFTIKPAVTVFTPNGFDQLGACTQTSITFDHSPAYTNFNIEYSVNGGTSWTTLATNMAFGGTSGTYSWSVPNLPTTTALVRVYPYLYTSLADRSDTTFTIKRAVTIIQPNFGGVLQIGTSYPILWSSDGISNLYDLAYSTNGGSTWTNIVLGYNTATNSYNWTVPNIPSTNCLIRIRDNINSCKEDISDVPFTISTTASPITVTHPNGLDTIYGCQSYNITWTESGAPAGSYNIAYSSDAGASWNVIASNYVTTGGSYAWTVPNVNSPSTLVRVASSANSSIFDLSNAAFTIYSRSVQASADTTICGGNQVQLSATGGTGSFTWTPAATLSNANIANPVASPVATTNYVVASGNGSCMMRDTVVVTVLTGSSTAASVSIAASPSAAVCSGNPITFTATPGNGGTNPVYQWKKNGLNVGLNSATYVLNAPSNNDVITCVLTSNAPCVTSNPATSNAITVTIFPSVTPTISISTASTTVCNAAATTFTAAITNGGNSPVYQWKVNGVNAGTNSSTFITSSLLNNDVVSCQLTSNAACPASTVTSSNSILMTVTPAVTPSISISSPITTICSGTSLTFTAVATNGGSSPSYQWKVNGSNAGTNSSTFTTSTLNNNDVVSCVLTSNANCAAPTTATSNAVTVTVTGTVAPTVSVSPSATSICSGQPVTFTATATNGGASPGYQWKVNGVNQSGSTNTFNSSTLLNNDTVRVVLTSSSGCASPATATSLPIVMTVNPNSSPSITISTSTTTVCNGTQTTFTATATNAGSSPTYQWKVNGTNAGTNSSTFSTFALSNNDSVWCTVTSASACAVPNNATSNKIKMTVVPNVTPSVSIATTTNSICSGNTAVFTATASNGGASPSYQWKVNGLNAGTNNASFSSATLNDNDVISCVLTSNAACATPATATSNAITMSVGSSLPASVSISASATTVCSGVSVTFTATPTNGGVAPLYQWKVNGLNVGSNSSSYSSSTLSNNDVVSCQVTSSSACANPATAGSNAITMTITPAVTPSISISSPITTICSGTSLTFTAVATNGGSSPSYQWKVNGSNAGTNSSTFTTSTLNNNDVVSCSITSNASCLSVTTATSNSITVTGSGAQPSVSISTTTAAACAGTAVVFTATVTNPGTSQSYQWKVNGLNAGTGASFSSTTLQNGDTVVCVATVNSACLGAVVVTSNKIGVSITPTVSPSVAITASQNGICSGTTVTFNAVSTNAGTSPVYVWKVNGVAVGTNASVLVASTLSNQDTVTCTLQSSAICAVPAVVVSNRVIMNITPQVTPSITISTQSLSVCQGSTVTFNATIANGGVNPIYRWTIDGLAAGSSAATLTTSALSNGSIVKCMLISSANCALPDSIVSNTLTITHAAPVTPAVAIVSTGTNTCQGALQSFAATASNGGTSPVYSWLVNGLATGIQTSTFSSDSLHQGDVITCRLTSSVGCVTSTTVQSNSLNVTVTPSVVPTISIATATTNICFGALVNFTASITNGGSAPAYQWYVDGTAVGANSSSYSNSTLFDGNTVYCRVISNAVCAAAGGTTSNPITMSVTTTAAPTVAVTSSADSICSGGNVTFTATAANAGTNPVYQWKVNGIAAGSNAATFAGTTFNNNDQIVVTVTSSAGCNSGASVTSNPKVVRVLQPVTPTVAISTNDTVICAGTNVVFHAQASNTGSNPVYQWRVNGVNTGNTSAVFASNTLTNNDQVSVKLSSNAMCATTQVVVSNTVTLAVTPLVNASVAIAANPNDTICAGTQLLFTATAVNGGATPVYQWQVNGIPVGTNSDSYASNSWSDQDIVTVQMQSSAFCVSQNPVLASPVTLTVYDLPAAPVVSHQGNVLQSSAPAGNQWYRAAAPISGATAATYTINNSGWYSVKVTDMHGCSNRGDSVFVNYNGIAEIDWNKQVTVLPNPFEEEFTIAVSAEVLKNREWNVTVTTAGGQTIYTAAIHEMRTNIILQDAPGGVYFVNLRSGNDLKTYRVVKLH